MEAKELITGRRSIRKFTDQAVTAEVIEKLVELASCAPSWKNTQTPRYRLVLNQDIKNKIAAEAVCGFDWNTKIISGAPALVVLVTKTNISGYEKDGSASTSLGSHWQSFDAGLAAQTFCLAAHEAGLGTVILGIYDAAKVAEMIGLPEGMQVSALIPIGYPAAEAKMPPRKAVSELLEVVQ